jgi:hypothetical protein
MKNIKLTVSIVQPKLANNKIDSFWYDNDIAYVNLLSGNKIYAVAEGEIRVNFEVDSEQTFRNDEARQEATRRAYNDGNLDKIGNHDGFGNNNWFNLVKVNADGEVINDDLGVYGDYDEVLKQLLLTSHEEHKKEYTK